jgi:hypothetical protein
MRSLVFEHGKRIDERNGRNRNPSLTHTTNVNMGARRHLLRSSSLEAKREKRSVSAINALCRRPIGKRLERTIVGRRHSSLEARV